MPAIIASSSSAALYVLTKSRPVLSSCLALAPSRILYGCAMCTFGQVFRERLGFPLVTVLTAARRHVCIYASLDRDEFDGFPLFFSLSLSHPCASPSLPRASLCRCNCLGQLALTNYNSVLRSILSLLLVDALVHTRSQRAYRASLTHIWQSSPSRAWHPFFSRIRTSPRAAARFNVTDRLYLRIRKVKVSCRLVMHIQKKAKKPTTIYDRGDGGLYNNVSAIVT